MSVQGTKVLFRTAPEGTELPGGTSIELTEAQYPRGIRVSPYPAIRMAADNRDSSQLAVTIRLMTTCDGEPFATLDSFTLLPGGQYTIAYNVPGTRLKVFAEVPACPGCAHMDLILFGFAPYSL